MKFTEDKSLVVTESKFENNSQTGLTLLDICGSAHILNTVSLGNGQNGIYINELYGDLSMTNSSVSENNGHGILMEKTSASALNFQGIHSYKNQLSGARFHGSTVSMSITNSDFVNNEVDGLYVLGGNFHASKIRSTRNGQNGVLLQQVSNVKISFSVIESNGAVGLWAQQTKVAFELQDSSTSHNQYTGLALTDGNGIVMIEALSSVGNGNDGLFVVKQDGLVNVQDCVLTKNKKRGIYFCDGDDKRLQYFRVQKSNILLNSDCGVKMEPLTRWPYSNPTRNISMELADNLIANNSGNGVQLSIKYFYFVSRDYRKVFLTVNRNLVLENKGTSFYIDCPAAYKLTAKVQNNTFQNNRGNVITISDRHRCGASVTNPVDVEILSNQFINNKALDHVLFVDLFKWPNIRFVLIKNNTFSGNDIERYPFPNIVRHTIAKATVVIKEGNFTIMENSFENQRFPYHIATLLLDFKRVVIASRNWWDTINECNISDAIFDFQDRLQLAHVKYYPFLLSTDRNDTAEGKVAKKGCFWTGKSLGGILERDLTIAGNNSPYHVVGDIVVLPNATLTITRNVTLVFPPQSALLVQGRVFIRGAENEMVKFVLKKPSEDVRLTGDRGPWEGLIEIKINDTWMPLCIWSFNYQQYTVCSQLGYQRPINKWYTKPTGSESNFIYNVQCGSIDKENIFQCNRQNWVFSSSCRNYVPYVQCTRNYWAGVHLAMTGRKSVIHNLLIDETGYSYRSDIPGIGLRIDFSHHDLQKIVVNNSVSTCTQVMYVNPFTAEHTMRHLSISNCGSHGVRFDSPYLRLKETNVSNTAGYGLIYESNWNSLNTDSVKMGDPAFVMNLQLCAVHKTIIPGDDSFYFIADSVAQSPSCKHIIETTEGYKIGVQFLYLKFAYGKALRIYDQVNVTNARMWKVEKLNWQDRPVLVSNGSSLLLEVFSTANSFGPVHFFVFAIRGEYA